MFFLQTEEGRCSPLSSILAAWVAHFSLNAGVLENIQVWGALEMKAKIKIVFVFQFLDFTQPERFQQKAKAPCYYNL